MGNSKLNILFLVYVIMTQLINLYVTIWFTVAYLYIKM